MDYVWFRSGRCCWQLFSFEKWWVCVLNVLCCIGRYPSLNHALIGPVLIQLFVRDQYIQSLRMAVTTTALDRYYGDPSNYRKLFLRNKNIKKDMISNLKMLSVLTRLCVSTDLHRFLARAYFYLACMHTNRDCTGPKGDFMLCFCDRFYIRNTGQDFVIMVCDLTIQFSLINICIQTYC